MNMMMAMEKKKLAFWFGGLVYPRQLGNGLVAFELVNLK